MTSVSFTVEGKPKGKARHRTTRSGHTYTPAATKAAEREIAWTFRKVAGRCPIMTGAVALNVEAVFRVPKAWSWRMREEALEGKIPFTGKPDADNILKLVMDALNGVAWVDDSQVHPEKPIRRYGEPERTEVTLVEQKSSGTLKSPAERRREAKVASGMVGAKRRPRRNTAHSSASELLAIGKRLK